MQRNTLRTREFRLAYLFGPPRFVTREEAGAVHGALCEATGLDDIGFRYTSGEETIKPSSRGFRMEFDRRQGRGGYTALIEYAGGEQAMRLLAGYTWPESTVHVKERFQQTTRAVFATLEGECRRINVEVRQYAQCNVAGDDSLMWMLDHLIKIDRPSMNDVIGKPSFASIEIEVPSSEFTEGDYLAGPKRHITIQMLREDRRCLFFNVMSQWSVFPEPPISLADLSPQSLRLIHDDPDDYIDDAEAFLRDNVLKLAVEENQS